MTSEIRCKIPWPLFAANLSRFLEDDKRATTNVQNDLVFFFVSSFKRALILRKALGGKVWKSAKECEKVPK